MFKSLFSIFSFFSLLVVSTASAKSAHTQSINGATGLITTPSAYIIQDANFALNGGMHTIAQGNNSITPKATLGLFKRWEVGGTYDAQGDNNSDMLFHTKLRFYPWSGGGKSALALGGNIQILSPGDSAWQIYLVSSRSGKFFNMQAETSIVIGKTFGNKSGDSNIDFSVGFDVNAFPSLLRGYLKWISEIGNFSYSNHPVGAGTGRGIVNTGLRLDILKDVKRFSFNIDFLLLDIMDTNRSFALGFSLGAVF